MIFHVREREHFSLGTKFLNWGFEMSLPFIINSRLVVKLAGGSVKLIHEYTLQVSVIEVRTVCLIIPITSMATVCIPTWQSFIPNTSNSSKMPCLFCSYFACLSRYLWFTEHRVTGERKNEEKEVTRHGVQIHRFFFHSILREINYCKF